VDFYLAPLYRAAGIPTEFFPAVFALSRTPGWLAHTLEQYEDSRLIRPRAEFVGPADRAWQPPSRRS
jgi:citrate synthase